MWGHWLGTSYTLLGGHHPGHWCLLHWHSLLGLYHSSLLNNHPRPHALLLLLLKLLHPKLLLLLLLLQCHSLLQHHGV